MTGMHEKSPNSYARPKAAGSTQAIRNPSLVSNLLTPEEIEALRRNKKVLLEECRKESRKLESEKAK
jgi:hypothetical protein